MRAMRRNKGSSKRKKVRINLCLPPHFLPPLSPVPLTPSVKLTSILQPFTASLPLSLSLSITLSPPFLVLCLPVICIQCHSQCDRMQSFNLWHHFKHVFSLSVQLAFECWHSLTTSLSWTFIWYYNTHANAHMYTHMTREIWLYFTGNFRFSRTDNTVLSRRMNLKQLGLTHWFIWFKTF